MSATRNGTLASAEASDVLIVGGGLAGLTLANYLARQGRKPLIVEQATEWRNGGYGIGLWADGIDVLDELGRLDAVRERAADPGTFEVRSVDRGVLTRTSVPAAETLLLAVHRGDRRAGRVRATAPSSRQARPTGGTRRGGDGVRRVVDAAAPPGRGRDAYAAVRLVRATGDGGVLTAVEGVGAETTGGALSRRRPAKRPVRNSVDRS